MAHITQRFTQDTVDSHQAWLWIASLLALIYSLLVAIARLVIKWRIPDRSDLILAAAYVLSLASHICIYVGLGSGLGKASALLSPKDSLKVARLIYGTRFLLFPVLCLTRISVLVFVRQLFRPQYKVSRFMLKMAIFFVIIWALTAPLIMCGRCRPEYYLSGTLDLACERQNIRFYSLAVMESLVELMTTILPICLCLNLQLRKSQKVLMILGFSFRITIFPIGIYYLLTFSSFLSSSADNIGIVRNLILQESLMSYTLILATAPCLHSFLRRLGAAGGDVQDSASPTYTPSKYASVASHTATRMRSTVSQVRNLGACSVLDTFARPVVEERRPSLAYRPDLENQHWANVMRGPPTRAQERQQQQKKKEKEKNNKKKKREDRSVSVVSDGDAAVTLWDVGVQDVLGWEKERALQIMSMPRRESAQSIEFLTMAER